MGSQNERIDMSAADAQEISYDNSLRGALFLRTMQEVKKAALAGNYECKFNIDLERCGQSETNALDKLQGDLGIRGYDGCVKLAAKKGTEVLCAGPVTATVEVSWHE